MPLGVSGGATTLPVLHPMNGQGQGRGNTASILFPCQYPKRQRLLKQCPGVQISLLKLGGYYWASSKIMVLLCPGLGLLCAGISM